jgi:hypothetical protein
VSKDLAFASMARADVDPCGARDCGPGTEHPRVIRRPALPISAIGPIEPFEIYLLNRTQHRPHKVLLRQPIRQRRRQQEHLAASHEMKS